MVGIQGRTVSDAHHRTVGQTLAQQRIEFALGRLVERRCRRQKILNWFSAGYSQAAIIFPFLVAAPSFFAKTIQLGLVMQISSAFQQVQGGLSYIVSIYPELAAWLYPAENQFRIFCRRMMAQ